MGYIELSAEEIKGKGSAESTYQFMTWFHRDLLVQNTFEMRLSVAMALE